MFYESPKYIIHDLAKFYMLFNWYNTKKLMNYKNRETHFKKILNITKAHIF